MCDINTLQQKIADLTNNGEIVIRFLAETVQGKTPAVQPCHRLEATSQLIRLGVLDNHRATSSRHSRESDDPSLTRHSREACPRHRSGSGNPEAQTARTSPMSNETVRPEPVEGPTFSRHSREACPRPRSGSGNPVAQPADENPTHPVTYLDILNFNLAQLIRSETADGHTIVEFLLHIMTGRDSAYTPNKLRIKPADRMAASREILRRGYGHFGRRRKLIDDAEETNDYDTLHTDLAKRLRQYSEEGSQVILFLLNVMKNEVPDEEYTTRHRMSAAQELLRRGWDTNYDKIKSEHLIDYWQDQQSARLSVGQKKQLAGLQTYADEYDAYDNTDYEPQAQALRAQQDRESEARDRQANNESTRHSRESEAISPRHSHEHDATPPRHSRESGNPEAQNDRDASPSTTSQNTVEASGRTPASTAAPKTKDTNPPSTRQSREDESASPRHSREACPRPRSGSGNPAAQNEDHPVTPNPNPKNTYNYTKSDPDPEQDGYYEPLSPEDQALFDYHTKIESGDYEEDEIQPRPVTEADRLGYQAMLKWIQETAQAEGVPVLPNPLSGTFKHPKARSP